MSGEEPSPPSGRRRLLKRAAGVGAGVFLLLVVGYCVNGLNVTPPSRGEVGNPAVRWEPGTPLRVLAYNLKKVDIFAERPVRSAEAVRAHLDRIAELIRKHDPHLVMLSEVVVECALCPVDQVAYLARATGMHAWSFGEQYNAGLPGLRIRGGNAILSRLPLRSPENVQLAGGKPFFWPMNNRRILWSEVQLGASWLRVASIHNDSFDLENNARQVRQILADLGDRPALLAGDFNAEPETDSLTLFMESKKFTGKVQGEATYPAHAPTRRIDYVLAPRGWKLVSHQVIESTLSDHRPVLSVFVPSTPR